MATDFAQNELAVGDRVRWWFVPAAYEVEPGNYGTVQEVHDENDVEITLDGHPADVFYSVYGSYLDKVSLT